MQIKNDKGMTLVEVLASLVIISILIISFLSLFGQTAKQNKNSEQVMDATYVAQTYMEVVYGVNSENGDSFGQGLIKLKDEFGSYIEQEDDGEKKYSFETITEDSLYFVDITLYKPHLDSIGKVFVKVYDTADKTKLKAQMETVLLWRGE